MANRLANATSPYLLQHADNPVDWHEWGEEAFDEARRRDVPILLSVGYAACHWCHVMAHESFEDTATAAVMNERFVNIKVDREERPDVDAVYMKATQAMTGHGGWPMTCLLDHEGRPFFTGTYFPPEPRHGMPSFGQVLEAVWQAWRSKREQITRVGDEIAAHLSATSAATATGLDADDLDTAMRALAGAYDAEAGGFGSSPKFPPSMVAEFCLRYAWRTGSSDALAMAEHTAERMARGGLYDQIGGGFARYAVDRHWRVPHFEKMLYDNALLLRFYLHLWRQTGADLARRVAEETARFLLEELGTPEGGFASALDADSDGEEGTFYVWTPAQLAEALGPEDGAWAARLLSVTPEGTFERGASTLQLLADPDDPARWRRVRERLAAARAARTRPARDDKVVAAWNGMAIAALAEAGVLFDDATLLEAARRAAELLLDVHLIDGRLCRVSRDGRAGPHAGVLEDHGCLAEGLLVLFGATGEPRWLTAASGLLDTALERFADPAGGFFDTADDAETLLARPQDAADNASPSGTSALAVAALTAAAITGEERYRAAAEGAIASAADIARRDPRFAGWTLVAAEALASGPVEVAVVGDPRERLALHRAALAHPGAAVVVAAGPEVETGLLAGRGTIDGRAAAYACQSFVCRRPVTEPGELVAVLDAMTRQGR